MGNEVVRVYAVTCTETWQEWVLSSLEYIIEPFKERRFGWAGGEAIYCFSADHRKICERRG